MISIKQFNKLSDYLWEIPKSFRSDMQVPARIYATEQMLKDILHEKAIEQLINVATLPGIEKFALAMPDIHQGYGFPIGGIAAIRSQDGIISPGGVGYDINCGVRLLASEYHFDELKEKLTDLINQMQREVPSGVGRGGQLALKVNELDKVLNKGINWAVNHGYALKEDQELTESNGYLYEAEASLVSSHAKNRGADQLGTLGSGNHFVEIQKVVEIFDENIAKTWGLFKNQITIMIHTGSRGLGHQVCTDYVKLMNKKITQYSFTLPDRELACAPFHSPEGQDYFQAMCAAANFAWVNRQLISHHIRQAWIKIVGKSPLKTIYDVAHNIAKLEKHFGKEYMMHRKGATRSFCPHHPEIPTRYQSTGQPVLIPGSMGTYSYVLVGTDDAMKNAFGSTCHGAGRSMSRAKAKKTLNYSELRKELSDYGVIVRSESVAGLLEEAPAAYKDIHDVIETVATENLAKKVAKLKPVAIIK